MFGVSVTRYPSDCGLTKEIVAALSRTQTCPRSSSALRPRPRVWRQALAIARDIAGGGEPQRVLMRHDVAQRAAQGAQPERLADDERVQRDREDQRVFL